LAIDAFRIARRAIEGIISSRRKAEWKFWLSREGNMEISVDSCLFSLQVSSASNLNPVALSSSRIGGIMPESKQSGLSDNSLGAIAYITVVPAIFFLAVAPYNRKPSVRFHAWQSIILSVVAFLLVYILSVLLPYTIPFGVPGFLTLNWIASFVGIAFILIWIWCIIGALNGKRIKLPLIGAWSEKQANR
jgi:uncharacterized membrane protein